MMSFETLPSRFGFDGGAGDVRLARRVVVALLLIYVAAFFLYYPNAVTNTDEAEYLRGAELALEGRATVDQIDPFTGEMKRDWPSEYPLGTSLSMAPFIALAGVRGAYIVPLIGLLAGVMFTARWLQAAGRSPIFALLVVGFPATLVMARVAMSDTPSLGLVAAGLFVFWRGIDSRWPWWLAAGFLAGVSIIFRESNALVFAPFFAGTLLRRESKSWALVAGGLAGVALRLLGAWLAFDDPFFTKQPYIVELHGLGIRILIYLAALLIFIPGALVSALAYRGDRWPELRVCVVGYALFFLMSHTTTYGSGLPRRLILDWRYLIPLLPVLAFASSEAVPRLYRWLGAGKSPMYHRAIAQVAGVALSLWVAGIAIGSVGTQRAFHHWSASQATIPEIIDRHTGDDSILVTNRPATRKFLRLLDRRYSFIDRAQVDADGVRSLVEKYGVVFIVFLSRNDSEFHRDESTRNIEFIEALAPTPEIVLDQHLSDMEHLQIWRVTDAANPEHSR